MTDIHLETISPEAVEAFFTEISQRDPDIILVTGDIDERNLSDTLRQMYMRLRVPICFVLGNHDYYRKRVANVRATMEQLTQNAKQIHWMPRTGIFELTPSIGLIGHGGWADGRLGDFLNSSVMLQDYLLIGDLMNITGEALLKKLKQLGDQGGKHIRRYLPLAMREYNHVVVLTHVPPFQAATWYNGATPTDDDPYLPHFSCKAIGDALVEVASRFPDSSVTVLCGHTHSPGDVDILDNLTVKTGGAVYGQPEIQQVFELE